METKPGYKTTEFWTMMGIQLLGLANLTGIWDWASNYHGGIIMSVVGAAYAVARGIAKQGVKPT